jgi:hypothetical protein
MLVAWGRRERREEVLYVDPNSIKRLTTERSEARRREKARRREAWPAPILYDHAVFESAFLLSWTEP